MIAECDDGGELAEVLAEVYKMLPPGHQAGFRTAAGLIPSAPAEPAVTERRRKPVVQQPSWRLAARRSMTAEESWGTPDRRP